MNASINGPREKFYTNPPLHDGIMLLIYQYIKSHSIGKFFEVKGVVDEAKESLEDSQDFSNMKNNEGMHLEDDEEEPKKKGKRKGNVF